jgi:hypothetical protein
MDKTIKLLEEFLKDYTMEGACGFWVQPDEEGGTPSVYIVLDLDWIQSIQTKPDFVARRMRQGLKEDIKNWTGVDVHYVGSTAKKCDNTKDINESVSTYLRRRFSVDKMKEDIDNIVDYELNPCEFDNVDDFISEACDLLAYRYFEDSKLSDEESKKLYPSFVNLFEEHLTKVYNKRCVKGLRESLSPSVRRRLSFDEYKESLDNLMEDSLNPCSFDNVGEFISEVCDIMVYNLVEDLGEEVSPRDKDNLYYYFVDTFGEYIANYYKKECNEEYTNESIINWELWHKVKGTNKKIIVTESQYNRLFEQKKSKVEMFQDLINDKLEYIRGFCNKDLDAENYSGDVGFETCAELEMIDSIKVDEVNMMTGARTDMDGNMYDSTPSIYVKLMINYSNLRDRYDFDEITYDLKNILKNSTGKLPIVFDYRTNNINKIKE